MISHLSKINNLTLRIITGTIGATILIGSIIFSQWAYFIVFFFICMFTLIEFYKLVGIDGMLPLKFWGTVTGLLIYSSIFLVESEILGHQFYFLIFPALFLAFFIKLYKKSDKKPFTNIAFTFLGIIYVAIPFALLHYIAYCHQQYDFDIILGVLVIIWANDTGAYFTGVKFGKNKLFYRISPKKTWEGFTGGAIFAISISVGVILLCQSLVYWQWIIITGIVIIVGTYGDLVESLFKRSILIKDSGKTIPGHGGFLDRFDGLLSSVPFIVAFLKIF